MSKYLFFTGHNSDLSFAEIEAIFPQAKITSFRRDIFRVELEPKASGADFCRLGGTTKVATLNTELSDDSDLVNILVSIISESGHKNFSISTLKGEKSDDLVGSVKNKLEEQGIKSRYLLPTKSSLAPQVIRDKKVTEILLDLENNELYLTTWTHDYKGWIHRDRNKPFVTPKSGMVPPKLGRIMANLALGENADQLLVDPFCGTGTILMEAALMGASVVGSDISPNKIEGTQQNLGWLPAEHYCQQPSEKPVLMEHDATHLSTLKDLHIDTIATEPTLGPASPDYKRMPGIATGLAKLYKGMLKDWAKILEKNTRVVIAFPRFHAKNGIISTLELIDSCEKLGYNIVRDDLIFTRPKALIDRQITILTKN